MVDNTESLADLINEAVYKKFHDYKTTIFLCGAGPDRPDSLRAKLDIEFRQGSLSYRYDVFYPEDLFEELIIGTGHQDLITLENMLAESVDAVVLVIESMGAAAELGSFSSNEELRKKLVVLCDNKYRRAKSFINYGPLRLMRDTKQGKVVFADFDDTQGLIKTVRGNIGSVRKNTKKSLGVKNVVQAHYFVLSCIYLLEPILHDQLVRLVERASGQTAKKANALTASAVSMLTKRGEIETHADGYQLSDMGARAFLRLGMKGKTRYTYDLRTMDEIRVDVLNSQLRGS